LTNTVGIVLDPIMSLRRRVRIEPGDTIRVNYITGTAKDRDHAIELAGKYRAQASVARAFELALTRSQVETSYLNLRAGQIKTYQNLIRHIVFPSPVKRKYEAYIGAETKGQPALWSYGISGDVPIVLLVVYKAEDIELVKECLKAHEYWRTKGLTVDLVILNRDESDYLQPLQERLNEVVHFSHGRDILDRPGGIFVRNAKIMPAEDLASLYSAARIILRGGEGPIEYQVDVPAQSNPLPVKDFGRYEIVYDSRDISVDTECFNGYGGFSRDGREYAIKLKGRVNTPAPWINVISNRQFGFHVSESGSVYAWAENSRENKLTPWSNDPVSDPPGEVIYIRDEDNGDVWTITPLPVREEESYVIRHGPGYTVFHHDSHGIEQQLTMFVPKEDPVKISVVGLENHSGSRRRLSLTYYVRPVMGVSQELTQRHIVTQMQQNGRTILIKNMFNSDFAGRIAFVGTSGNVTGFTCDREEFIGLGGSMKKPVALKRERLSGSCGAGYDPCVVLQVIVELDEGQKAEMVFMLGQAKEAEEVRRIVDQYQDIQNCKQALKDVNDFWSNTLGTLQVRTPDRFMDVMLNTWFLYQTIACRLWARSAFYQSGGAFGFRDQLQDALNVVYAMEDLSREQILLHCAHQFVEGDVLHWWHPGREEKGIRTRFSDDLLWLPYVTAGYINRTGDYDILTEQVHYIEYEPLAEGEDERYGTPRISDKSSTVYEHCIRAIQRSLRFGEHGIPLIGSGDWNDGFSTVGNKGKGESIWLGWFLCDILTSFAPLCKHMGDNDRANEYLETADRIAKAIELNGWDGGWYRRAYFDDGRPLGSAENDECTIDSIAQSWALISGWGSSDRAVQAMESVERYLVRREEGLVLLFTPPFDESDLNPGYIKGYVPGVRENGGQYTHAAAWVVYALALMGEGDKAWELYSMINPINHARTSIECATYKVEPYVAAADVYAVHPHIGRGGWTWYTGAAGWLYKVGIENILGFKKNGNKLTIDPCIPKEWKEYRIEYRYGSSRYYIIVTNPDGVTRGVKKIAIDQRVADEGYITLQDDSSEHWVEVLMGAEHNGNGYKCYNMENRLPIGPGHKK
jgi:cyclic beta-1,2-glucan synthetase